MKLLTPENLRLLPPLYSQEDKGDEAVIYVKWFTPWSSWTWYVMEYDPDRRVAYAWCVGPEPELGYVSLDELEAVRGPGDLRVERDLHFDPTPLKEVRRKEGR